MAEHNRDVTEIWALAILFQLISKAKQKKKKMYFSELAALSQDS